MGDCLTLHRSYTLDMLKLNPIMLSGIGEFSVSEDLLSAVAATGDPKNTDATCQYDYVTIPQGYVSSLGDVSKRIDRYCGQALGGN